MLSYCNCGIMTIHMDYPIIQRISELDVFPDRMSYFSYIDDIELLRLWEMHGMEVPIIQMISEPV